MSRTMVALDFSKKEDVMNFLDKFDKPIYVKVGMELTYAFGFEMIREIKERGHKIFLDLKLHDIPNTVKNGMKNLAKLDVDVVNLHVAGGSAMMKVPFVPVPSPVPRPDRAHQELGITPRLRQICR